MVALFEGEILFLRKVRIALTAPRPRLGQRLFGPGFPTLDHVRQTLGLGFGKVVELSAIGIDIVQLPRAISALGDELPFALAHGAVAFVLPKDRRLAANVFAVKSRRE